VGAITLNNIIVTPLAQIPTEGGDVMHAMKAGDAEYSGFGEAYFSRIASGSIKAWKRHTKMVMNLIVPVGMVRFVFHLDSASPLQDFRVIEIGEENYARITVPSGIWFGFQGLGQLQNLVLNISSISHDSIEVERKPASEFIFDWNSGK
jgi:dTDP-4-dehydrorhamnose 3,5-epimerase